MYPLARISELLANPAQAVALGLSVAVAVGPIGFGGVLPAWPLAMGGAVTAALCAVSVSREFVPQIVRLRVPVACLLVLALQCGLQATLPLSAGGSASPEVAGRTAVVLLLTALAALAAARCGISRRSRRLLLAGIVGGALFQLVYGTGNWLRQAPEIFGFAVESQPHRFKGTFVNPNHLATYLLAALCALQAWIWWSWRQVTRRDRREAAVWLIGVPTLLWMCVLSAFLLSGSRSGLLAAAAGAAAQGVALLSRPRRVRAGWAFAAVVGVGLAAGAVLLGIRGSSGSGASRLAATQGGDASGVARLVAWRGTVRLWSRAPLWGHGAGSFEDAFPVVQPTELTGSNWQHAHSDWLEVAATQGLFGLGVLVTCVAALWRALWEVARRGEASEDRAAGFFGIGLVVALGLQECFEFGLTRPANAVTVAVLLGAAAAARLGSRRAEAPAVTG